MKLINEIFKLEIVRLIINLDEKVLGDLE